MGEMKKTKAKLKETNVKRKRSVLMTYIFIFLHIIFTSDWWLHGVKVHAQGLLKFMGKDHVYGDYLSSFSG